MAQLEISWDTLGALDNGAAGLIINAAIKEALVDLDDRSEDGKPRGVEVRINMTKRPNGQVEVDIEAAAKIPRRRTASTCCNVKVSGTIPHLLFQEHYPGDPDQRTIDELE